MASSVEKGVSSQFFVFLFQFSRPFAPTFASFSTEDKGQKKTLRIGQRKERGGEFFTLHLFYFSQATAIFPFPTSDFSSLAQNAQLCNPVLTGIKTVPSGTTSQIYIKI